ncbi:MAG: hypothetical protein ACLFT4_10715 [Bacteroidales bacterium]
MKRTTKLSAQRKEHSKKQPKKSKELEGNTDVMTSTGSTLLDLAISGTRVPGGGIPGGILVEIFGPSGSGKTVMLVEMAGMVQRASGNVMFRDPEARLNKTFAKVFDLDVDDLDYDTPDTIPQLFQAVRNWDVDTNKINGVFADSLAALSTDMEMENEEGDKMGMRRAKEFSEELRRTCRILKQRNLLMVASNQVRVNQDAGFGGQKYISPGGEAIGFYSSLRLRTQVVEKIKDEKTIRGKKVKKVVGIKVRVEVFKSSIDSPYRTADVYIYFDYGIDDIRANLQFIKDFNKATKYMVDNIELDVSMDKSITMVEEQELEDQLKEQVIDLWEEIQKKFDFNKKRKRKKR